MTILDKLEEFVEENNLFGKKDRILIAVSGGIDSMTLVDLIGRLGIEFGVAHCNFQLRGKESDEDADFVRHYAKSRDIPFYLKRFNTEESSVKNNLSIQETARQLRYQWFAQLMLKHNYPRLATGHNASDQSETVIYNLVKGKGVPGLRGIPVRNEKIVRPLLFATRQEIQEYAHSHAIVWREDSSNRLEKYSRNLIRHSVIPKLKQINPGLDLTILRSTRFLRDLEFMIGAQVEEIKDKHLKQRGSSFSLDLSWLKSIPGSKTILFEILRVYGFNSHQALDIHGFHSKQSGRQYTGVGYTANLDRKVLYISPVGVERSDAIIIDKETEKVKFLDHTYTLKQLHTDRLDIIRDGQVACLDLDKLYFPLTVRNWRAGDTFIPLGMTGQKKLSDFMIDQKIPVNLKKRLAVFESQGDIIWIAGYRIDDRFKVTGHTKNILVITESNAEPIQEKI